MKLNLFEKYERETKRGIHVLGMKNAMSKSRSSWVQHTTRGKGGVALSSAGGTQVDDGTAHYQSQLGRAGRLVGFSYNRDENRGALRSLTPRAKIPPPSHPATKKQQGQM